jgi:protein SCO1/2
MDLERRRWLTLAHAGHEEQEDARETIRRRYFPDVWLRAHDGRRLRLYQDLVRGRVVTLNYMYIQCTDGTCPVISHNLSIVQEELAPRMGRDLFLLSITLDPEMDTPQALAAYARQFGAGRGWLFLAPEPREAEMLRRRLGFFDSDPEVDKVRSAHTAFVRVGNEPKMLWAMAPGTLDAKAIVRTIHWVSGA